MQTLSTLFIHLVLLLAVVAGVGTMATLFFAAGRSIGAKEAARKTAAKSIEDPVGFEMWLREEQIKFTKEEAEGEREWIEHRICCGSPLPGRAPAGRREAVIS